MADDAEDVLELTPDTEIEDLDGDAQTDGEVNDEGGEEIAIGFSDEEAAPASEGDSSVIRDLRKANRVLATEVSALRRANPPQTIELGDKPTLASCGFEDAVFEAEFEQWQSRKAQADRQTAELESRKEVLTQRNTALAETYKAGKVALRVSDFDDAESLVSDALPHETMAILLRKANPALVYALAKSPTKRAALAKFDPQTELPEVAFFIGELGAKLTMDTRKPLSPERRVTGSAGFAGSTDKELARLEKEAERTGDRTKLGAHRRKLRDQAA